MPASPASLHEAAAVGVVAAERRVLDHHGVHGSGEPGSFVHAVQEREYRPLVGHGDVEAPEPEGRRSPHRQGQVIRLHVESDVDVVQTVGCEGGVVHSRAQAMLDGVPDQGEQPRLTAYHPLSPRPSLANPYETAVYPIQGAFRAFGLEGGAYANPLPPAGPTQHVSHRLREAYIVLGEGTVEGGGAEHPEGLLTAVDDCG